MSQVHCCTISDAHSWKCGLSLLSPLNLLAVAGKQNKSRKKKKVNEMSPVSSCFDCRSIYRGESCARNQSCSETKSAIMDSFGLLWRSKSSLVSCEWSAACEFYITPRWEHLSYIFCISSCMLTRMSHQLDLSSRHTRCLGKFQLSHMINRFIIFHINCDF